jgi:hypothetical protein
MMDGKDGGCFQWQNPEDDWPSFTFRDNYKQPAFAASPGFEYWEDFFEEDTDSTSSQEQAKTLHSFFFVFLRFSFYFLFCHFVV